PLVDGTNNRPTCRYPIPEARERPRRTASGASRGGSLPRGAPSMTPAPPHMVVRRDNLAVDSPYWLQTPFNGTALRGVNPYGPDEGTPDQPIPFPPAAARRNGRAHGAVLAAHVDGLTLAGVGDAAAERGP